MQKPNKKPYVPPKLKEHGVVRDLTQSSSGGMQGLGLGMGMGMDMGNMGMGMG
jgi:hypothetical protein